MTTAWNALAAHAPSKAPLRVLHVNPGNLYGGVETFLTTLAQCRRLCRDMVPEFAVCVPGRLATELAETGVRVHVLGAVRLSRPWTALKARAALDHLLCSGRVDVAVCHQPWTQAVFGGVVRHCEIPYVGYFHGPADGGWPERLARRLRPRLIIAPSRHSLAAVRPLFPDVPGEVLNYPLPPQAASLADVSAARRAEVRTNLGAGPGDVVILQASRLERWKGPDVVLRALGRLKDLPNWRFWLAGGAQRALERAYFRELEEVAAATGIADRVAFLGQRTDVDELMRAADVYCQGNRGPEGFSLSFLEACSSGLPVVTSELGGAREMIGDWCGLLVPPDNADLLADALRKLIQDPGLRATLSARARDQAVRLCDTGQQLRRLHAMLVGIMKPGDGVENAAAQIALS
jgi:glycosyltransferase involved in cell wall biosynthesis